MTFRSIQLSFYIMLAFPLLLNAQIHTEERVRFLALGDSYTIGQSVEISSRWPVQLIDSLRAKGIMCDDPRIIATTGWRTDNLKGAIQNANLPDMYNLVSLLIGVNNFYQGKTVESYIPEFSDLLDEAIHLAGGDKSHVFVLSIPDYGYTPFGMNNRPAITAGINAFNAVNKSISEEKGITYINITDISRQGLVQPALVASDGLHPSGKMYTEWVKIILDNLTVQNVVTETDAKESSSIEIYPNPAGTHVRIENLPGAEKHFQIIFRNGTGQTVSQTEFISNNRKAFIDISTLTSDAYFYELSGSSVILKTGKLIKR